MLLLRIVVNTGFSTSFDCCVWFGLVWFALESLVRIYYTHNIHTHTHNIHAGAVACVCVCVFMYTYNVYVAEAL